MEFKVHEIICVLPIIWLFLASLVPISLKAFRGGKDLKPLGALAWGIIGLVGAGGLTLSMVSGYWNLTGFNFVEIFSNFLIIDGITVWSCYMIYAVVGLSLFLFYDSHSTRDTQFSEHLFLALNATVGMALVVMSNNLIMTFVSIELMSLSTYLLIALSREKILSKESSFKYFVLGSVGSAILLYGMAFIYGSVGSLSLQVIGEQSAALFISSGTFRLGVTLVLAGLAFKVSLVPFHSWTPDVYQGAATPVTAIMATGMKIAGFVALIRFFLYGEYFEIASEKLLIYMQWLAALTMIVGNIAAVRQSNLKRMLAYSSIAHSGYAFMGIIAFAFGYDGDGGISSLLFYLFSYSIMTIGTFALVNVFESSENTVLQIDDLKNLAKKSPYLAFCLSLLLFSLAGLPPSLGFFGKFYIFSAAIEQQFYWLAFIGVMSSVVGVYYYLRPVVVMYMMDGEPVRQNNRAFFSRILVYLSAASVAVLGVFSSSLFQYIQDAVLGSM